MRLPQAFLSKMKFLLGEEFDDFEASYQNIKLQGLRVNTLKISVEDFLKISPFNLSPIPWCDEGFYFSSTDRPAKHPYYHAGLYYIQEPSAMAPVVVLDPKPGELVLDLCAAPGGKTIQIATALMGDGVLVTNDIHLNRVKAVIKNIELYGIKNAIVTNENPEKLSLYFGGFFDKILVDAPCSGEGMFRKDPGLIKSWEKYKDDYYSVIQKNIMDFMDNMLKQGGTALYSTCTFSPEENEGVVQYFLEGHQHFKCVDFLKDHGFAKGVPEWVHGDNSLTACARLWPHKLAGEGHFMSLLEKESNTAQSSNDYCQNNGIKIQDEFKEFVNENLEITIEGHFETHNDQLYRLPYPLPSLKGLKVLRSGWLLGTYKKNRFEPSQALAMGLSINDVRRKIDFKSDDSRVIRYLKGETLDMDGEKGWTLVCVDGFPLGWGKHTDNLFKNYYPAAWRWLD